jgi:hypothetical protein
VLKKNFLQQDQIKNTLLYIVATSMYLEVKSELVCILEKVESSKLLLNTQRKTFVISASIGCCILSSLFPLVVEKATSERKERACMGGGGGIVPSGGGAGYLPIDPSSQHSLAMWEGGASTELFMRAGHPRFFR